MYDILLSMKIQNTIVIYAKLVILTYIPSGHLNTEELYNTPYRSMSDVTSYYNNASSCLTEILYVNTEDNTEVKNMRGHEHNTIYENRDQSISSGYNTLKDINDDEIFTCVNPITHDIQTFTNLKPCTIAYALEHSPNNEESHIFDISIKNNFENTNLAVNDNIIEASSFNIKKVNNNNFKTIQSNLTIDYKNNSIKNRQQNAIIQENFSDRIQQDNTLVISTSDSNLVFNINLYNDQNMQQIEMAKTTYKYHNATSSDINVKSNSMIEKKSIRISISKSDYRFRRLITKLYEKYKTDDWFTVEQIKDTIISDCKSKVLLNKIKDVIYIMGGLSCIAHSELKLFKFTDETYIQTQFIEKLNNRRKMNRRRMIKNYYEGNDIYKLKRTTQNIMQHIYNKIGTDKSFTNNDIISSMKIIKKNKIVKNIVSSGEYIEKTSDDRYVFIKEFTTDEYKRISRKINFSSVLNMLNSNNDTNKPFTVYSIWHKFGGHGPLPNINKVETIFIELLIVNILKLNKINMEQKFIV